MRIKLIWGINNMKIKLKQKYIHDIPNNKHSSSPLLPRIGDEISLLPGSICTISLNPLLAINMKHGLKCDLTRK